MADPAVADFVYSVTPVGMELELHDVVDVVDVVVTCQTHTVQIAPEGRPNSVKLIPPWLLGVVCIGTAATERAPVVAWLFGRAPGPASRLHAIMAQRKSLPTFARLQACFVCEVFMPEFPRQQVSPGNYMVIFRLRKRLNIRVETITPLILTTTVRLVLDWAILDLVKSTRRTLTELLLIWPSCFFPS